MSSEATAYVKGLTPDHAGVALTRAEKRVLFVLARCINPSTAAGCVDGGLVAIAKDAQVSRPWLLHTLKRLEARQLISRDRRVDPALGTLPNVYRFLHMPLRPD